MDKCQLQINSQRQRLADALNEKDGLVRQIAQSEDRVAELDRTIIEARGIIAGIEHARQVQAEEAEAKRAKKGGDDVDPA